jgi:D-galactose 1-dehydrogenase
MEKIKIAVVGFGKIARDQHIPALAANDAFELVAVVSPHSRMDGVRNFHDLADLLQAVPDVRAVSLCMNPQVRYPIARLALDHGLHVLLEKPPGMTVSEVTALVEVARRKGTALFATWHSRHASAVESARDWLIDRSIRRIKIVWKEDVRVWHPGQTWIWKPGGLGVFDPGINALSILTRIVSSPFVLLDAHLAFPANCATPIAASMALVDLRGTPVQVELDFLQTGPQTWDIEVETDGGLLKLSDGGSRLVIADHSAVTAPNREYPSLYACFAELVRRSTIDVDVAPLQLVADAFLRGRRTEAAPFVE